MKLFQTATALSLLLPCAGVQAQAPRERLRGKDSVQFQAASRNLQASAECVAKGEAPFITEEYVIFLFDGEFSETDVLALDEAFVEAYDTFVDCSVAGAERELFDAEALQVDLDTSTFLLRAAFFCNSCGEFRNADNATCTETSIDLYENSLFPTVASPGPPECVCDAPTVEDVVDLYNDLLNITDFSILGSLQLCALAECDRQPNVTTYTLEGVCLAEDLLPLSTAAPRYGPRPPWNELPQKATSV